MKSLQKYEIHHFPSRKRLSIVARYYSRLLTNSHFGCKWGYITPLKSPFILKTRSLNLPQKMQKNEISKHSILNIDRLVRIYHFEDIHRCYSEDIVHSAVVEVVDTTHYGHNVVVGFPVVVLEVATVAAGIEHLEFV